MTRPSTARFRPRLMDVLLLGVGALIGGSGYWGQHYFASADTPVPTSSTAPVQGGASAQKPAASLGDVLHAPLLAASRAGPRIVAVGDHGVVLLSDDEGKTFRQAKSVPAEALLTSLSFIDAKQGWAAGHDGVVLHTVDGGEIWTLQREDLDGDRPLFSVRFRDALHGLAVGLFGTAVQTEDGGKTWTPVAIESGDENDHHLYAIFGSEGPDHALLLVAGESGAIYRSADGGQTWATIQTSNLGSFWAGARLADGSFLAVGQRGHIFRSTDEGLNWTEIPSGTQQSLTSVNVADDGSILITGLAGITVVSHDNGKTFTAQAREDRIPLNAALITGKDRTLLFGGNGVVQLARQ